LAGAWPDCTGPKENRQNEAGSILPAVLSGPAARREAASTKGKNPVNDPGTNRGMVAKKRSVPGAAH